MADTYQYIINAGLILPDTSEVLTDVQDEFRAAFGNDLVVTPDTPQGVLIAGEVLARSEVIRNNAALGSQINPNLAGGIFLDAICALTGLERLKSTPSTVSMLLTGQANTIVPAGTRVSDGADAVFQSITTVIIGSSGNVMADFQAVTDGPVAAPSGTLTTIVDGVLGLETVINPASAVLGNAIQSDASLRTLRRLTMALQGVALPEAITSALYVTEGVKSLSFRENIAATTQTIDGVSMVAHSIYVCVDGGTDQDVAKALLANKSMGANYNGSTTVDVTDPISGQVYPVKFDRPETVAVLVKVYVRSNSSLPDPQTVIPPAVLAYANGQVDGEPGFIVDGDVSPFEIAAAINLMYSGMYIQKVEVALASSGTFSTSAISIGLSQKAITQLSSVTVVQV